MAQGLTATVAAATRSNGNPGTAPGAGTPAQLTVSGGPYLGSEGALSVDVTINAGSENKPPVLGPFTITHTPSIGDTDIEVARAIGRKMQALGCVEAGNGDASGDQGAVVFVHVAAMGTAVDIGNASPAPV